MDAILAISDRHGVLVIEYAAQGIMATHDGRAIGAIFHVGTLSVYEIKNITLVRTGVVQT